MATLYLFSLSIPFSCAGFGHYLRDVFWVGSQLEPLHPSTRGAFVRGRRTDESKGLACSSELLSPTDEMILCAAS